MGAVQQDFHGQPWLYDIWQAFILLDEEEGDSRYGIPASLDFPPTEVDALEVGPTPEEGAGVLKRLSINLPGLLGPVGPGPVHLAEAVIRQTRLGNSALQDFIDIFHNHFLRLWRAQAMALCPELGPARQERRDDIGTVWLLSVAGMLTAGLRKNPIDVPSRALHPRPAVTIPDAAFFLHASLWRVFPHSSEGFKRLVRSCLGLEVELDQFAGTWVEIPPRRRCRLGGDAEWRRLGQTALIGSRAFHDAAGVRIRPVVADQFDAFHDPQVRDMLSALFRGFAGTDLRMELVTPKLAKRATRKAATIEALIPLPSA
ncbi:MAG: type VI secretion system baseplate subunit TssG [Planctomycetaceae bacterium]|nr:type VI secretion system baseplate subunit TssG [Planctomycetaceae bacterium]